MKRPTAKAVAQSRGPQFRGKSGSQRSSSGVWLCELVRLIKGWVSFIARDIRLRLRVSQRERTLLRASFSLRLETLSTLLQSVDLIEAAKRA
jgi:hypothetical protein